MTPRAFLLAHVPTLAVERSPLWDCDPPLPTVAETVEQEAATLGLRAVAAVVGAVEARGVVLPGIDARHRTAADARRLAVEALPEADRVPVCVAVVRALLDDAPDVMLPLDRAVRVAAEWRGYELTAAHEAAALAIVAREVGP